MTKAERTLIANELRNAAEAICEALQLTGAKSTRQLLGVATALRRHATAVEGLAAASPDADGSSAQERAAG